MKSQSPRRTPPRTLVTVLVLIAAYAFAGRLSLLLAIPPGYATAIWPPSGLALAGLLMGGARVWPAIWLGSFLVNLWTAFETTTPMALLTSVAVPTSIGVGAVLQTLVAATLVHRVVGFPSALTQGREIGAFLVLGGPVSCLVGASVGVTTLVVSGRVPWEMFPIHWGTWWVGDTLGVLIVTPLVLSWLAEPRAIWRRRRLSVALPLLGALALAIVVFVYTSAQERERLKLLFGQQATTLAHTLQNRLDDSLEMLYALESFYAGAGELSPQAFHMFVQRLFTRHPGLQALSWDRRLPDALREAYEETARREGSPDFQITEQNTHGQLVRAARRPEYVVVSYIEPSAGNVQALGFDVASAPDRLDALQRARDTGQPRATGRLTLVQEPGRRFGLLVFMPVYGPGLPHATVEERRQNLHGYVTGVFWINDLIEAALHGLEREGLVLRIEDEAAPAGQRVLYDSAGRAQRGTNQTLDEEPGEEPTGMRWDATVELAGRRWALQFTPTLAYLAARQSLQPWVVLAGGLVFTSLLGAFLLIVTGRATITEQLAAERAAQLEASQRQEERFRVAVEAAPNAMIMMDQAGAIVLANTQAETLFGYRRAELIGQPIERLVPARYRHGHLEHRGGFFAAPHARPIGAGRDLYGLRKDGREVPVEIGLNPIETGEGMLVLSAIVDITARKQAEAEQERLHAQLRQAQKMEAIGTLAGGIAHDFNNILGTMLGYAELALGEISRASAAWVSLQEVLAAGHRAKDLVQQILTFSRQGEQARQPIQLHLIVTEALRLLRASLPATIDIRQYLDPAAGAVLADPIQLHQVLMNLCSNAEHAMRQTGGVLEVCLEAVEGTANVAAAHPSLQPGPYLRLTVRDSGQGMSSEVLERIFDPFFTTKAVGEGTGLGLAIVHGIIADHGGAITVQSAPREGTTVTIYLPRTDHVGEADRTEEPIPGGSERILLVDDEEALARVWQYHLERLGYTVVACSRSAKALDTFRTAPQRFDLVITDQTMPLLTGEVLALELRRIRPDIPIILCTGFSHTMTAEKAGALGMNAYLLKPLSTREVALAIRRILDQPHV
jgi:PAS domain S-box-containing protein